MSDTRDKIGCEACSWTGTIEQGPDKPPRECECGMVRRLAWSMPDQIRLANVERAHLEHVLYSRPKAMGAHLFVKAHWDDMCAIIKALWIRHMGKPILVTSDAEVKSVFVGSKSKVARSDDYKGVVYNDLLDLMSTPGLMIMKLGQHTSSNKALPKAFEEALRARFFSAKPIWLVSDPDLPFGRDSIAWSDQIWKLIEKTCIMVDVPMITRPERAASDRGKVVFGADFKEADLPRFVEPRATPSAARPDPPAEDEPVKARPRAPKRAVLEEEGVDPTISVYGSGITQSKSSFRRSK